jgi:hypothetical protein
MQRQVRRVGVSGQRLGKHVPTATDKKATMTQQQRNGIYCGPRHGCCYAMAW